MKKLIALALMLACMVGLCSCSLPGNPPPPPEAYAFETQYIRTDGYSENRIYPCHVVINSREELEAYYETNKELFDLERREAVYSDTTIGFMDACDKYDDAYFERQNLILILLEEGSGSIRHKITDVRRHGDENGSFIGWDITIKRTVPEVGTDDIAQWHLFLEVQMGNVINSDDDVWINGKLSTNVDTKTSLNTDDEFHDHVPYDAMLNLEVMDGKFRFQRIATTPCIVYSNTPITDMSNGTMYSDRHDILTSIFQTMDGKDAFMDVPECDFSHYIYMFDNEREDIPWHYRFAICNCGAVMITNNDEQICTIELTETERRSIFPDDLLVGTEPLDTNYPIGEIQLHPLYEKYPEYWDLDGMKGVEVYLWQTEDGNYRCGALIGTNRMKSNEEIQVLFDNGATIEEMRTIFELCEVAKDHVSIIPVSNPLESEWYKIDVEEIAKYLEIFWGE